MKQLLSFLLILPFFELKENELEFDEHTVHRFRKRIHDATPEQEKLKLFGH